MNIKTGRDSNIAVISYGIYDQDNPAYDFIHNYSDLSDKKLDCMDMSMNCCNCGLNIDFGIYNSNIIKYYIFGNNIYTSIKPFDFKCYECLQDQSHYSLK